MAFKDQEFPIVGKKLERMCAATQADKAAMMAAHAGWDMHDVRVACFQRLFTCWNPTLIGLVLAAEHLETDEWWDSWPYRSTIPQLDRARSTRDYLNVLKIGYLHATTSVLENTFRLAQHAAEQPGRRDQRRVRGAARQQRAPRNRRAGTLVNATGLP
ncbi:MAG: hypothetical protein ACR2NO_02895 [Chloroflexota bacterium]